jgi:hypothetical protein
VRAGYPVEVTVQAPAAYAVENVSWTGWTVSLNGRRLEVWHVDLDDDGARLQAVLHETDAQSS